MKETLEEAAENYTVQYLIEDRQEIDSINRKQAFKAGAKWQQEKLLEFINDEENHTEGELGNSCIDVQSLIYFIGQEVRHSVQVDVIDLIQFLSMNQEFNGYGSVSKETAKYFLDKYKKSKQ